jgi:hypothetical protein
MEEKIFIRCPECSVPINFTEAVKRLQDSLGDILLQGMGTYYLTCEYCQKKTIQVTIDALPSSSEEGEPEPPERLLN